MIQAIRCPQHFCHCSTWLTCTSQSKTNSSFRYYSMCNNGRKNTMLRGDVHMTSALTGGRGLANFWPKEGSLLEFGTDKGEGGCPKFQKFSRRHMHMPPKWKYALEKDKLGANSAGLSFNVQHREPASNNCPSHLHNNKIANNLLRRFWHQFRRTKYVMPQNRAPFVPFNMYRNGLKGGSQVPWIWGEKLRSPACIPVCPNFSKWLESAVLFSLHCLG